VNESRDISYEEPELCECCHGEGRLTKTACCDEMFVEVEDGYVCPKCGEKFKSKKCPECEDGVKE
jgi:hypothetical protein